MINKSSPKIMLNLAKKKTAPIIGTERKDVFIMRREDFEFQCDSLSALKIEDGICFHYRLGDVNHSDTVPIFEQLKPYKISISATNGNISCRVYAYKNKDNDLYTVEVSAVDITKRR